MTRIVLKRRAGDVTSRRIRFDRGPPTDVLSVALARINELEGQAHLHREVVVVYKKQLKIARETAATLRKQIDQNRAVKWGKEYMAPATGGGGPPEDAYVGGTLILGPEGAEPLALDVSPLVFEGAVDADVSAIPNPLDSIMPEGWRGAVGQPRPRTPGFPDIPDPIDADAPENRTGRPAMSDPIEKGLPRPTMMDALRTILGDGRSLVARRRDV